MAAQQPARTSPELRARLHSARANVGITPRPGALPSFSPALTRGMKGVYQHCGEQHLHRYASEFEFRYNHRIANDIDDTMRANAILKGAKANASPIGGLTQSSPEFRSLVGRLLDDWSSSD